MKQVSKKQFTSGAMWKIIESFSSKGITMVVSFILARMLYPEDYGVIALTTIFINFSNILIEGGFSTTLIRKKDVDDSDYSCVLTVSFTIATVLYIIFFIIAPYVAEYYEEPLFCPVLRVLSLTVFISAFSATRSAIVNRNMQFRFLCYCNIISSIISGAIGIIAAYNGAGVWALVIQRLLYNALLTTLLFIKVRFKIKWMVSIERIKEIVQFSTGVISASLLYFVANNLYGIVIGKKYSVEDLGYYSKGNQLPEQLSLYTFTAVSGVLLPTISSYQDDVERVKHIIRKVTAFSSYVIFPLMVGLMLTSDEMIVLLLSAKWRPAAPIMIGACIYYIGMPFTLMNAQVYYALGHSFMKLRIEVIRFFMMAIGLFFGSFVLNCSISQLAIIGGIIMIIAALISAFEAGKMLHYSFKEMFVDIWKPIICTAITGIIVWFFCRTPVSSGTVTMVKSLLMKTSIGITVYIMLSIILKVDGFYDIKQIVLGYLKRNRKKM